MVQLSEHFGYVDGRRESIWLRLKRQFAKSRSDQVRQKQQEAEAEEDVTDFGFGMVLASDMQIAQFEAKLDTYDTATVAALMQNQQQLDAVRARITAMLQQAYVMEDGRRVFKTEDGTQVFDEHGAEVLPDELNPDLISGDRPTAEAYFKDINLEKALEAERTEILEFQEKVDNARDQISDGDITEAELEALEAELEDALPNAVRAQIPGFDAPNLKEGFALPTNPTIQTNITTKIDSLVP